MRARNQGVVLALVLVIALILSTAIFTFVRRATLDAMIVHNRDRAARAEALARGGVQLAVAVVLQDLLDEQQIDVRNDVVSGDTLNDLWARAGETLITTSEGDELRLRIRDTGSLLNLNSIIDVTLEDGPPDEEAEEFLTEFFGKVIDEVPGPPGDKLYDPREMARSLIDFIDANDISLSGSAEDDYYLAQDPPYRPANRPLLSIDELSLVEGFDAKFVEALRPYVTVYPLATRTGINLNTAPQHVLAAVYHGGGIGDGRLASEDTVRRILRVRDENGIVCDEHETDTERCIPTSELVEGSIFPPTSSPAAANAFQVLSRATVGDMERTVEAVIDRSKPTEPRLLFWRIQ